MQRREHQHARVAPQVTIWQRQLSQVARVALQATIQRPLVRLYHVLQVVQPEPMQRQEPPLAQVAQQVTILRLPRQLPISQSDLARVPHLVLTYTPRIIRQIITPMIHVR